MVRPIQEKKKRSRVAAEILEGLTALQNAVRSGTPSASPSCTAFRFDCPDRRSGWSSGFHSCSGAVAPSDGAGAPPIEGLTITLSVLQSAPAGPDLHGTATVTNHSSVTVSFEVRQPRSGLRAIVSGSTSDGTAPTDAEGTEPFQLAPGASDSVGVTALTTECGDTSRDQVQPLPAGSYRIGVTISYDRAQLVQDATGSPEPSATPGASARASGSWSAATTITLR